MLAETLVPLIGIVAMFAVFIAVLAFGDVTSGGD